jgi:hypothetical protein
MLFLLYNCLSVTNIPKNVSISIRHNYVKVQDTQSLVSLSKCTNTLLLTLSWSACWMFSVVCDLQFSKLVQERWGDVSVWLIIFSSHKVSKTRITSCNGGKEPWSHPKLQIHLCHIHTLSIWIFCVLGSTSTRKVLEWTGVIWDKGNTNYSHSLQSRVIISRETDKNQVFLQLSTVTAKDRGLSYCAKHCDLPAVWFQKQSSLKRCS